VQFLELINVTLGKGIKLIGVKGYLVELYGFAERKNDHLLVHEDQVF
jgi:hypothetical protein